MSWLIAARIAIVVTCGAVAVFAGRPLVDATFRLFDRASVTRIEPAVPHTEPGLVAAARALRGGAWIGQFERAAIFATILAGFPAGIAVVLGLKGLARYPELRATSSGAAERFIIGTFTSVLFACALAGLAWWGVRAV